MPGHDTTNMEYRDRISKIKEILIQHNFSVSAVPVISSTFKVALSTAWRYKLQAEKEIKAAIDLTDQEAIELFVQGVLDVYHATGSKAIVKLRALDMLARAKGVYRPKKIELTSPLENLPDEELEAEGKRLGLIPSTNPQPPGPSGSFTDDPNPDEIPVDDAN